jgi:hypothetical protein
MRESRSEPWGGNNSVGDLGTEVELLRFHWSYVDSCSSFWLCSSIIDAGKDLSSDWCLSNSETIEILVGNWSISLKSDM